MSRPSTAISRGGLTFDEPLTLICNWTICPTAVLELLNTAVTLGPSAQTGSAATNAQIARTIRRRKRFRRFRNMRARRLLPILIDMTRCPAFIQLHPLLFILHRLQKHLRLLLTHLAFLLR